MARISKAEQAIIDAAAAEVAAKAAQQAELKRLRAEKAAAKKAAAAAAEQAAAQAAQAAAEAAEAAEQVAKRFDPAAEARKRMEQMASAVDAVMADFAMPSAKRMVAAVVISLICSAGAGWLIGLALGALIVGAVALTGMAWLGWVIYVLGMFIAFYTGMKVAGAVGGYIIRGDIDRHLGAVKNKFVSFFTSKPVIVTGAFVPGAA